MSTQKKTFCNKLTDAEAERLALLVEECAEVQQVACKILRHGYESYHPSDKNRVTNRQLLEIELGDLRVAAAFMLTADDLDPNEIAKAALVKTQSIPKYLHHQEEGIADRLYGLD